MKIANPIAVIGEDLACEFLKKKGYKIIERNFRKGYGEIDIICIKNKTLVFVEVKTRTSKSFGTPIEAISYFKLKSLIKTAEFYSYLHPELPHALRIDAISVMLDEFGNASSIEHTQNISGF
jgi:putative endonuclease